MTIPSEMSPVDRNPLVSFVFTGRNDDYGSDFRRRLQHCVSSLYRQLSHFRLNAEIIFVNYNPLPEPEIIDFIKWPASTPEITVKIITVPGAVHEAFLQAHDVKKIPVLEYIAKNAGIRRSKGDYVLCMNPDIVIPDGIIRYMGQGLRKSFYYKANRMDVKYAEGGKTSCLRMSLKGHSFAVGKYNALLNTWWKLKYAIINSYKFNTPKWSKILDFLKITVYRDHVEFRYHCMAGGDFMLMHRNSWLQTGGYAEQNSIALHVDSLMTVQAATLGLKEHIFREPVIHEEHGRRFTSDKMQGDQLEAYLFFQEEAQMMLNNRKNKIYNPDDWGLIKFELAETIIT